MNSGQSWYHDGFQTVVIIVISFIRIITICPFFSKWTVSYLQLK